MPHQIDVCGYRLGAEVPTHNKLSAEVGRSPVNTAVDDGNRDVLSLADLPCCGKAHRFDVPFLTPDRLRVCRYSY
ncbi:hypothetical protein [Streptomyces sp. So13.3]|uniref:hypothetical protein n=1 Tax=Streptomyces sp. So13.3 TaxID=2136173 RepID=UPI001FD1C984|nr:hypothetical protein [Streptomyces sp. So13.3]